jgi:hypothetical protein
MNTTERPQRDPHWHGQDTRLPVAHLFSHCTRLLACRNVAHAAKANPRATASGSQAARARRSSESTSATNGRTAPGATKASVLAALAGGDAMTAGQVATKAGLARPTVSTTLSKLAKTGEVEKAARGYRLTSAA